MGLYQTHMSFTYHVLPKETKNCTGHILFQKTECPTVKTRPLEPILIPKLRITVADFPYAHLSNRLEATNPGDLMRLLVRTTQNICITSTYDGFSRDKRTWSWHLSQQKCSSRIKPLLEANHTPRFSTKF